MSDPNNFFSSRICKVRAMAYLILKEMLIFQSGNRATLIAEKVNKAAQQQHSGGQKHNFPVCKKIFKWYHSMVMCKSYGLLSDEW